MGLRRGRESGPVAVQWQREGRRETRELLGRMLADQRVQEGLEVRQQGAGGGPIPPEVQRASGGVIPRANFFPKSPGLRPRSRSFSGFNTMTAEAPVPLQRRYG